MYSFLVYQLSDRSGNLDWDGEQPNYNCKKIAFKYACNIAFVLVRAHTTAICAGFLQFRAIIHCVKNALQLCAVFLMYSTI